MQRAPRKVYLSRVIPPYFYLVTILAASFTLAALDLDSDHLEAQEQTT